MSKFLEAISLISWWGWSGKLRHFLSFQKNIMSLGKLVGGIAGLPDEVCPPDNIINIRMFSLVTHSLASLHNVSF